METAGDAAMVAALPESKVLVRGEAMGELDDGEDISKTLHRSPIERPRTMRREASPEVQSLVWWELF